MYGLQAGTTATAYSQSLSPPHPTYLTSANTLPLATQTRSHQQTSYQTRKTVHCMWTLSVEVTNQPHPLCSDC